MKTLVLRFSRQIAAVLVFLVAAQMSEAAALPLLEQQQQTQPATSAQASESQAQNEQIAALPDSPAPAGQPTSPGFSSSQDPAQQQSQQPNAQQPVGTAAGPATRTTGVAGSRPSGAAIAPAKQRRRKAIVIRVALIVAGAAAAGAVVGLSKESPSRP